MRSRARRHAVMLIPDQITRDGMPITNNNVWVGQQINLTNVISGVPTNSITYHWGIPGANNTTNDTAFYDYEPNATNSNYTNLFTPTNYTTNNYIHFYWSYGASNQTVYCTNVIYGKTYVVSSTFNVLKPDARITATIGANTILADTNYNGSSGGIPWLHFGTHIPATPGMTFTQTHLTNVGEQGSFVWNQILKNSQSVRTTPTETDTGATEGYDVDITQSYPYDTNQSTQDSPGIKLRTNNGSASYSIDATMYLMYQVSTNSVNGDKTVPIPLRGFRWTANYSATNIAPTNNGSGWFLQNAQYPTNNTDFEVTNEVQWNTNSWQSYHVVH